MQARLHTGCICSAKRLGSTRLFKAPQWPAECRCRSHRTHHATVPAASNSNPEPSGLDETLKRDLERQQARKPSSNGSVPDPTRFAQVSKPEPSVFDNVKDSVDKVLVADFFFVFAALLMLGVGVGEKVALRSQHVLDVWYPLWPILFQPAIGILMAGALFSGLIGWLRTDVFKST